MLPCSELQIKFFSVVEQILEAILLLPLKEVCQVLDCVALEVLRVTSIQKSFFSLFVLRSLIFLLLLYRWVVFDKTLEVDLDELLDNLIL